MIEEPRTQGMDGRDAGLANAIYDIVVRRWLTLEWLLTPLVSQAFAQLEPRMRAVLMAGAAQLAFLDRVPAHAAIDTSVEWAKRHIRPKAGGMVNAVLRRVAAIVHGDGGTREMRARATLAADELPLEDGSALVLHGTQLTGGPSEVLRAACSMPAWLLGRWREAFGEDGARDLALHGLVRAPIVLNTAHARGALPADVLKAHESAGSHVFTGSLDELGAILGSRGDIWVQDAGSSHPVSLVRELKPRIVVDLCAGRGTKTRQLRAAFADASIFATDADPERLSDLARTFKGSEQVRVGLPASIREANFERADLVVLDVPCSNTGVLARRIEARYRAGLSQLERLTSAQRQIIADAIPLLAPGGRILYCTCSVEEDENSAQAGWACRWHGFKIEREEFRRPRGMPGDGPERYADGSYAAVLGRSRA